MSPSIRRSSLGFAALLAISCIVQFTTALPGGLRPRQTQTQEIPDFLSFIPNCASTCIAEKIAATSCNNDQACLCGPRPEQFIDAVIWACIDGECGGRGSPEHRNSEAKVQGACASSSSAGSILSQTESATETPRKIRVAVPPPTTATTTTTAATASTTGTATSSETVIASTATAVPISEGTAIPEKDRAVEENTGLSIPVIAGISAGAFCLIVTVLVAVYFCIMARNRKNHREQVRSMTLEPHSPRGGAAIGGGNLGPAGWMSINSTSTTTLASNYYSSGQRALAINTNMVNEKSNVHGGPNISPVSPVSPMIPQGFVFGDLAQQSGSRKTIEGSHLFVAPAVTYTPASPIGSVNRTSAMIAQAGVRSSSNFSIHSYDGDLPGVAISTDSPGAFSPTDGSSPHRHMYSTAAVMGRSDYRSGSDPLIPSTSQVSEGSGSTRSSLHSSHGTPAVGISRSDTLSWRRELDEAAGRALTRVLHSEQSVNEEMDAAKRRKSSIPGLDRFSRRLSRDNRADEENSLVGGERASGFWSGFGSKSSRGSRGSPPRNSGFTNKRSNSGSSGGSSIRRPGLVRGDTIV